MTPLLDAIYLYADKQLVPHFEAPNRTVLEGAGQEAERISKRLRELGEEPGRWGRRLWTELETQAAFEKEAVFLAGLAVGLELGQISSP